MLLHRMALVSVRRFCKNLGKLQEFFGQTVYRPPLTKNCPYAYVRETRFPKETLFFCLFWCRHVCHCISIVKKGEKRIRLT